MIVSRCATVVSPWYRQFYLRRGAARWASDEVSTEGYEARLDAIGGFVYVGTEMYGSPTEVIVEVHDTEPPVAENADRVVDASVGGDGPLAVLSWGEQEPDVVIDVPGGTLRLRAAWSGLSEAQGHADQEVGGDERSPERVLLQVWAAAIRSPIVQRRWACS
ncbi:MAG: hypothetical protein ACRDU8_04165 [Egibacteraceae bacterium]